MESQNIQPYESSFSRIHALRKALSSSRKQAKKILAENNTLREKSANKKLRWRQERQKLLDEKASVQKEHDSLLMDVDRMVNQKEEEVRSLTDHFNQESANKELSWQQERQALLDERDSISSTLSETRQWMDELVKANEAALKLVNTTQTEIDDKIKELTTIIKEQEEELMELKKEQEEVITNEELLVILRGMDKKAEQLKIELQKNEQEKEKKKEQKTTSCWLRRKKTSDRKVEE